MCYRMSFDYQKLSLTELNPQCVRMYLSEMGWKKVYSKSDTFDVFINQAGDREVVVPRSVDFSDYELRMRELLDNLSLSEKRTAIDIY